MDAQELFDKASAWADEKIRGAVDHLDKPTPCEGWNVQQLLDHFEQSKQHFSSGKTDEMTLGAGAAEYLIHGWDVAKATGQDTTMPLELAQGVWGFMNGKLTDDKRGSSFKSAINVADNLPEQDKLLAYTGRNP